MTVATDVASIDNMKVDPKSGILYFTNPQDGTIEFIRPDQTGSTVLYRGLDNPTTLSLQDGYGKYPLSQLVHLYDGSDPRLIWQSLPESLYFEST